MRNTNTRVAISKLLTSYKEGIWCRHMLYYYMDKVTWLTRGCAEKTEMIKLINKEENTETVGVKARVTFKHLRMRARRRERVYSTTVSESIQGSRVWGHPDTLTGYC